MKSTMRESKFFIFCFSIIASAFLCFAVTGTTNIIHGETVVDVSEFSFNWKINNFSFLPHKNGEYLSSDEFYEEKDERWVMQLYPNGAKFKHGDISLELRCVFSQRPDINLKFSIVFLNNEGEELKSIFQNEIVSTSANSSLKYDWIFSRSYLLKHLPEDSFTISCVMKVLKRFGSLEPKAEKTPSLYNRLLHNCELSDITFLVGDTKFCAHKAILASHSKVFYDMFVQKNEPNAENSEESNLIKIVTMKPEVFNELLHFVYTKNANLKDYSTELYDAAESYGLTNLEEQCESDCFQEIKP